MKYWQLEKLCLENAYSVKRVGKSYHWKSNLEKTTQVCDTVVETYKEILIDIEEKRNSEKNK
jgi:hypothetical protein